MKSKLSLWLVSIIFGLSLSSIASSADAHRYYNCRVIPAHWAHGYFYPAQKVCWGTRVRCGYVNGHWYRGLWYEGHRVCRYY